MRVQCLWSLIRFFQVRRHVSAASHRTPLTYVLCSTFSGMSIMQIQSPVCVIALNKGAMFVRGNGTLGLLMFARFLSILCGLCFQCTVHSVTCTRLRCVFLSCAASSCRLTDTRPHHDDQLTVLTLCSTLQCKHHADTIARLCYRFQ